MTAIGSEDLLSLRRILGCGAPGEEPDARRHSLSARFEKIEAVRSVLESVSSHGIKSLVSVGERKLFNAIGSRPNSRFPSVIPIVPNIQGFMREAVEHGMIGAGWVRLRRAGLASLMGLGLRGMGRASALVRRDFPSMLLCFIELEMADFRAHDPRMVFLQTQITDLALAMDNPRILEVFLRAVRSRTSAQPGFMTHNFGHLAERCSKWGLELTAAIAPWESSGAEMRPSKESCEAALKNRSLSIWSDRSGRPNAPSSSEDNYLRGFGIRGALRDDDRLLGLENGHR